jgi:nucleoside-diphosphate-sugar epimerase
MTSTDAREDLCLVTGATGFIGTRFCEGLMNTGAQRIRALVRSSKKSLLLPGPNIERARGDLLDAGSVSRAVQGCDIVVHLAHGDDRYAPIATRNLVEAACRSRVRRFVHVSSVVVHGFVHSENASAYAASKFEEEQIVRQAMDCGGLQGVILRPTIVYGPKGPFVTRVIEEARTGTVTVIDEGDGICNAVFVDDVCHAIEAAMVVEAALGKTMVINADHAVTWREFTLAFANLVRPPPQVRNVSAVEAYRWWADHPPAPQPPHRSLLERMARKAIRMVSPMQAPAPYPDPGRIWRESERLEYPNDDAKYLLDWSPRMDLAAGAAEVRKWLDRSAR